MSDTKTCYYCKQEFDTETMRPYAPGNEYTCFPCGMDPANKATTDSIAGPRLAAALAESPGAMILTKDGPQPFTGVIPEGMVEYRDPLTGIKFIMSAESAEFVKRADSLNLNPDL